MKVNISIECDTTNEAKELFKTLSGISSDFTRLEALQKAFNNAIGLTPEPLVTPDDEPITSTVKTLMAEAETEAVVATKRTRPSRAKAVETAIKAEEARLATGSDPAPYELSGSAGIAAVEEILAEARESSTPKTVEDVRVLAKALMNKGHNARLQEEMTKLGATRLSEIKNYDEAFNVLTVLSKEVGL